MRDRPLSASSIKTYLQCVLKYYYQYEDKKPRGGKSDSLAFGIAVHEALEELHTIVSETGEAPSPEVYNQVLSTYMASAVSNGLEDMAVYEEGRNLIINRLDNADPEEKVIGLELRFHLKTPKGTPFTGSIDKLVELDPETAVIIDYKTSRFALTQSEADTDVQFSMYDLAVNMLFPQYKTVVCAFDYLRLGEVVTHRTAEQRALFVDFLDTVHESICKAGEKDIVANINTFCGWCDFKGYCDKYQTLVTDPDLILPRIDEMDELDFVDAWEALTSAKKTIDNRQRAFKAEAYTRMKNSKSLKGRNRELYKTQSTRKNYDARSLFKIVGQEDFVRMANVGKGAVERYTRDNPEAAEAIEDSCSYSFLSPSFRTRKIK